MPAAMPTPTQGHPVRRIATSVAWVLIVVVVALAGAGLIAAVGPGAHRTGEAELTYDADAATTARLDAVATGFGALAADVDALGTQGRGALGAMVGNQAATVDAAIAAGNGLLASIDAASAALTAQLAGVPAVSTPQAPLHVSPAVRDRFATMTRALATTSGLSADWQRLTVGAAAAGHLATTLGDHDTIVGQAAALGRGAKYAAAITMLGQASAAIADARTQRDQLAKTVDVSVLDEWLDRNDTYDHALSALYAVSAKVGSKITPAERATLQAAMNAEQVARANLPPDARGLVVILGEIAQGGLNDAVSDIETARAQLADAVAPPASASTGP